MKRLVLWLLIPTIIVGTWIGPAISTPNDSPALSTSTSSMAQIQATPVQAEPETSDPAVTNPGTDNGPTVVAPADFPNVCDGSNPTQYPVSFTVQYPEGDTTSSLQVRIFAENNGCIPGHGYQVTIDFASGETSKEQFLPSGNYFYEYDGKGFEPGRYVYFQVVDGGSDEAITITPAPIPASYEVSVNVTLPADGSSMTVVVSDANGTIEGWTVPASGGSVTDMHTLKLPEGQYFYEYWGDDYPWSDRIPFTVDAASSNTISITPVIAAITLTPSQAPAESSVEVRVTGFRADDEYEFNFNNGQIVDYGWADINGDIATSFTVPTGLAPGKYPVVVTGAVSGQRVEATFTVGEVAQVSVNPTSGAAGVVISVSGFGYQPNMRVDILFGGDNGTLVGYVNSTPQGTFTGKITVPKTAAMETHTIVASQKDGPRATTTYTVTERPVTVTVSPMKVMPGTIVSVSGGGFAPNETVDIYWGSTAGPRIGYRTADSSGSFTGRVTVPKSASAGDHRLFATGRTSNATGSATLSVTAPQVTVSPTTQTSGKVVSVAGSGFTPNQRVDIRWNSPSGTLIGYVTANGSGSVSGKVTIPPGTVPGDYSIFMIDLASGLSGSGILTVTGATVTVTPSQVSPGMVVAVTGSGFGPNEVVDIRWNGPSGKLLGYRTTTTEGSMSGKVTIPADAKPGTYTLFFQGRTSGIVGSVTVVIPAASSLGDIGIVWGSTPANDGMVRKLE